MSENRMPELDWEARLRAAVEKNVRDRAARRAERAQLYAARQVGLERRHARKLRRIAGEKREGERTMTDTMTLPWVPVLIPMGNVEECSLCGGVLDIASITLGAKDKGPVCEDCAEQLPDVGAPLWELAQALDRIDSAIWNLPQRVRPGVIAVAHDMLKRIGETRLGPVTDEERAEFVAGMAAAGKLLRLPGGRAVEAAIYDAEKHGPFLP